LTKHDAKLTILTVIGARPQFIKAAAVSRAMAEDGRIREVIVHTGQHFDQNMSEIFFQQLQIPEPDYNLGVHSLTHGAMTGRMLERIEHLILQEKPDMVLVYGDTDSTLAGALAAAKLHVPLAHVEAGLRSFNKRMPEEINRVLTDHVSDLLFCPTETAVTNLEREGITAGVHQVGDVMYDSVLFHSRQAEGASDILAALDLAPGGYFLATVHRAENTNDPDRLAAILDGLNRLDQPVVLPLHPRTRNSLAGHSLDAYANIRPVPPVAYLDMLQLERHAGLILTDSGGVQKEAYWFNVPCVTLRKETEWVETVAAGWNLLVGADSGKMVAGARQVMAQPKSDLSQAYGNGYAANVIIQLLLNEYSLDS